MLDEGQAFFLSEFCRYLSIVNEEAAENRVRNGKESVRF